MILLQGSSRLFVLALIIFGGMAAYVLGEGEEGGGEVTGAGDAVPDGGGVTNAGGEGGGEAGPEGAGDASGGAEGGGDAGGGDAGGGGEGESGGGGEGGGEGAPEGGESGEGDSAKAEGGDGVSKINEYFSICARLDGYFPYVILGGSTIGVLGQVESNLIVVQNSDLVGYKVAMPEVTGDNPTAELNFKEHKFTITDLFPNCPIETAASSKNAFLLAGPILILQSESNELTVVPSKGDSKGPFKVEIAEGTILMSSTTEGELCGLAKASDSDKLCLVKAAWSMPGDEFKIENIEVTNKCIESSGGEIYRGFCTADRMFAFDRSYQVTVLTIGETVAVKEPIKMKDFFVCQDHNVMILIGGTLMFCACFAAALFMTICCCRCLRIGGIGGGGSSSGSSTPTSSGTKKSTKAKSTKAKTTKTSTKKTSKKATTKK